MSRRARIALLLAAALTTLCLAGCGFGGSGGSTGARSAADDVPALAAALGEVDEAMAARRFAVAKKLLRQLIADVRGYREAGDLDEGASGDIVSAARRLLAELDRRGAPATDESTTATDGPVESDDERDDASPRPTRTRDSEPTPEPSSEPTDSPSSDSPEPTTPVDPPPTSGADPATEETPAAYEPTTPAATASS